MKFLILGAKEFPVGASKGYDDLPSGGMEVYSQGLAKALRKQGHTPIIVTRSFGGKKFVKQNGIHIHKVAWLKGFFLRNPSFNLSSFLRARKIDYDACISNGVFASLAAIALSKTNHKPVIARPAGIAWVQPQYNFAVKKIMRALENFAYSRADAVVFLSEEEQKTFKEKMGFLPENSCVIPTGVDVKKFQRRAPAAKKRKKPGEQIIISVGRLVPLKGLGYLLEAMKSVDAKLLVVGKGPEENKLKKYVLENSLEEKVFFLGEKDNEKELPSLLKNADVFVLPSLTEGLPVALLEAMASSLPCLVTDIGLPVKNGKTALVVPPQNAKALSTGLRVLIHDKSLSKKIAKNGFLLIKKNFRWDSAAISYVKLARGLTK